LNIHLPSLHLGRKGGMREEFFARDEIRPGAGTGTDGVEIHAAIAPAARAGQQLKNDPQSGSAMWVILHPSRYL
jgi:hypothetical protein